MNFKSPCFPFFLLPFPWASSGVSESRKWDTFSNQIASLFTKQGYLELFWWVCCWFVCFFFNWKFRFLSMLDLKFRDPISLVFHEPCVMLTFKVPCLFYLEGVSEKNACSFERLTGRMGHQLCPAAAHKPLLSTQLCTASNKIKERGRN